MIESSSRPTRRHLTDSRLANLGAHTIFSAFDAYQSEFHAITARAQERFEQRDGHGMMDDAAARLDLYKACIEEALEEIRELLGARVNDKLVWVSLKAVYSGLIADRDDWELAETFFNSVTRRIFTTVGVDNQVEFVDTDFDTPPTPTRQPLFQTFGRAASTSSLVERILTAYAFRVPYENLERDAALVAAEIEKRLHSLSGALQRVDRAEICRPVFFRGLGAYLIGRLYSGVHRIPLALALLNTAHGIVVDAALLDEDDVSILFSFTRSYFHVQAERPYDLVQFLRSIMPRKRLAEIYISLGHNKHGKTELYRDLLHHLAYTDDRFEVAPGARGMVMAVFTLPSYDMVFKVIKDQFDPPKTSTRAQVLDKYRLVFTHDRAGRLIDAQEFEHLEFDRDRFSGELLAELVRVAPSSVHANDRHVVIKHLYAERRLTPLNIYVQEANEDAVRAAVLDYGNAIKDLASANIFPGDLLLKNFGVTRHGRIVFYDYDELTLLTDCVFRLMPAPRDEEEEFASEPWFSVQENDFFPEEFRTFLGLPDRWRKVFAEAHGDLFGVDFWQCVQDRLLSGEIIHIFPYPHSARFTTFGGIAGGCATPPA